MIKFNYTKSLNIHYVRMSSKKSFDLSGIDVSSTSYNYFLASALKIKIPLGVH